MYLEELVIAYIAVNYGIPHKIKPLEQLFPRML